jgi:hypothetical protein
MRKIVVILAAVAALAAAAPAAAQERHTSCQEWGASVADFAHASGGVGDLVSGLATGGAGAVADAVAAEHAVTCAAP